MLNVFSDQSVIILGYGVTGQSLARFCEVKNYKFWIWEDCEFIAPKSNNYLGEIKMSQLNDELAKSIFAIFPSPGAPQAHPLIEWGNKMGLTLLSDIEWASSFLNGHFIGVTGTNGKSTTVKLINQLLNDAQISSGLYGNIGRPLVDACMEPPHSYYVIEESSYQLDWIKKLKHKISICLNITEDHLDHHGNMQNYIKAKEKIFYNSSADDFFIYNFDNYGCMHMSKNSPAHNIPLSLVHEFSEGGFLKNDCLVIRLRGQEHVFDTRLCSLKGWHNLENMLASLLCCVLIDDSENAIKSYRKTLKNFVGLPHRVEFVHEENGVKFYDDSKATNVHSVAMALTCFDKNIILIAGGRDKGGSYTLLEGLIKEKVKHLLLIGEAQDVMFTHFSKLVNTHKMNTLDQAVREAKKMAVSGDVVLLSPACSSFDQFKNYHERGLKFQDYVRMSSCFHG